MMEEVDVEPNETSQDVKRRFSTVAEVNEFSEEPGEKRPQEEKMEGGEQVTPQKIKNLQQDLTALVTNIQTAADAKELMRRKELEEARRIRLERLENDVRSSQEQCEELIRGWSIAQEEVIPQELQEALNSQQQLCSALIANKKKLISELQQELKAADDRYVKDLRRHTEELDLMMERMEQQNKALTQAYREEMTEIQRTYQQEVEVFLKADKAEWEERTSKLWEKEMERLMQRKEKVEEYENTIHSLMLEAINMTAAHHVERNEIFQALERERQEMKGANVLVSLRAIKPSYDVMEHQSNWKQRLRSSVSLRTKLTNLNKKYVNQKEEFAKRTWYLSEGHSRNIQQYERMQKITKSSASADARKCKEMWSMMDAEVQQLADRALLLDSLICRQHLGLSWERPRAISAEGLRGERGSTETQVASAGAMDREDGAGARSEVSVETLKEVLELLCDEAGFLMEDKLLKLLAPLNKEEQSVVKLGSLISSLGVEEEDLPRLALFLLKYKQQAEDAHPAAPSDPTEAVESMTNLSSDLIDPNHIIPALKCFFEEHMLSRETSSHRQSSLLDFEAWDGSEHKSYWENMGNIIPQDRVQLWEAAEHVLKQHLSVLTEISELIPETEGLKQQNTELRMLLQQSLNSKVNTGLEISK